MIKVLLVDDDFIFFKSAQKLLAQSSYYQFNLKQVSTMADAFSELKSNPYDVVILDLSLPNGFGEGLFEKFRKAFSEISIIVLTGSELEEHGRGYIQKGAQDYLLKDQLTSAYLIHALVYSIERKHIEKELWQANENLKNKVNELSSLNEIMMGREEKILELQEQIKKLKAKPSS